LVAGAAGAGALARRDPLDRAAARRPRFPAGFGFGCGPARAALIAVAGLLFARAPAANQLPRLEDLGRLGPQLAAVAADLDDAQLAQFAGAVAYEEAYRTLGLGDVDWDGALTALREAAATRPALAETAVELAWQQGASRIGRGDYAGARTLLEEARTAAAAGGRLGWIESSLSQVASSQERWLEALEHLDRADAERERVRDPAAFEPWVEGLRAELWLLIGMPELAAEWVERRFAQGLRSTDPHERWSAFDLRQRWLLSEDDYAGLRELERTVQEQGWLAGWDADHRRAAERRLAAALAEEGQHSPSANAAARARLAALLADPELSAVDRTWGTVAAVLAELDAGHLELARGRLQALGAHLGPIPAKAEAFAADPRRVQYVALEGLVALAAADRGAAEPDELTAALARVQLAWSGLRAGWSNVPTRAGGIGYLLLGRRQVLIEALLGLQVAVLGPEAGAVQALDWLLEAEAQSTLVKRLRAPAADFEAVRTRLLGERRGLVAWVPLRGRSFVLAADARRARVFELPPGIALEHGARDLIAALDGAIRAPSAITAADLERTLAEARERFLPLDLQRFLEPWDSLYAVGLDDAGFVPLELLRAGPQQTFGSRFAVARLPSLTVGLGLLERPRPSSDRALLLLADDVDPQLAAARGLGPLSLSAGLVNQLVTSFGPRTGLRRGSEARLAVLGEGGPDRPELVHVVAHGLQRRSERPPGIQFAADGDGDGAAFAEELERLTVPSTVLLSVCRASRSHLRRGDGGRCDLAAALFVGGATAVGASATDLDLEPTLRAAAQVQRALAAGVPLAEALRRTRAAAEPLGREWLAAHAMQASGLALLPSVPIPASSASRRPALLTAALFAAVALGYFARRRRRPAPATAPDLRASSPSRPPPAAD
jgi:hypothetical protein